MAAELEIVGVMTASPACCLLCAMAPVDETTEDRLPLPAIHAIGLDVNWGDDIYICWTCAGLMADMLERPSAMKVQKVLAQAKFQKKRADKADKKLAEMKQRVSDLLAGRKAEKAIKDEARKGAKS